MSMFFRKNGKFFEPDYSDGRTKQAFKDSTDINKILKKAQISGGLSHALKYDSAVYGEFTGVDLLGHYDQIKRAQVIFDELPAEVRSEFLNDALKFAGYASDPKNIDRLKELIPAIAEPGTYFPDVSSRTPPDALKDALTGALESVLGGTEPAPGSPDPVLPAEPVVPPAPADGVS